MGYSNEPNARRNPITDAGFSTEHMAAVLTIAALILLILIARGFRGVSLGGAHVGVS